MQEQIVNGFRAMFVWIETELLGLDGSYGKMRAKCLRAAPASLWKPITDDPDTVVKALASPSRRRRLRKTLRPILREEGQQLRVSTVLLRSLWEEAPKQGDQANYFEEYERVSEEIISKPQELGAMFPPWKLVDGRNARLLANQIGGEREYGETIAATIYELRHHGHGLAIGKAQRRNISQEFLRLIGIKREDLEDMNQGDLLALMLSAILRLPRDEGKVREIVEMVLGSVLTKEFIGEGSAGPYSVERLETRKSQKKKKSQNEAPHDNLLVDDLPSNSCELAEVEDQLLIEAKLQELPAQQREDALLLLEADSEGKDPRELCRERGRKYETVQRNFERALQFLRTHPE